MVESTKQMQMDDGEETGPARGTMVTALCWVSRGFAKPVLSEADINEEEFTVKQHVKMQQKLAK